MILRDAGSQTNGGPGIFQVEGPHSDRLTLRQVKKSLILFHVAQSLVVYQSYSGDQSYSGETCTPLSNRETYSSAPRVRATD